MHRAIDGQAEAVATVGAWATAVRRVGVRIEEGVGAVSLVVEGRRVVAVMRSDGERLPCDTVLVAEAPGAGRCSRRSA